MLKLVVTHISQLSRQAHSGNCYGVQVTGEAVYVDDIPLPANALHAVFVLSSRPHAKLLSVDASAALQVTTLPVEFARLRRIY